MYFYLASKLAHNQPWLTWNSSNASSLYGILGISEFARMPWTAMITNFLVLPQNFIKLKIEPSFGTSTKKKVWISKRLGLKTFIETKWKDKCANMEWQSSVRTPDQGIA